MISSSYQEMIVASLILLILFYISGSSAQKKRYIRFCFFVFILMFYSCYCITYESGNRYEIDLNFKDISNIENIDTIIIGLNGKIQFNILKNKDTSRIYILKKIELIEENNVIGVLNVNKKISDLEKDEDNEQYFFKYYIEEDIGSILKKVKLKKSYMFNDENTFKLNIILEKIKTKENIEILIDDVNIRYIRKGIKFNNFFP